MFIQKGPYIYLFDDGPNLGCGFVRQQRSGLLAQPKTHDH